MKKQVLLFFALLCPVFAFCQGIRYDTPPILNSSGKPISGAVISLCPGTATISGSTCSPATAQGFTSITLGTACSIGSPVVLTGLNTCQATSDTLGNAGFWLSPGAYIYCINAPSQIGQCYNLTVPIGVTPSGNVNISPNSFTAGSIPSPGPIGGTTPNTGTFTTLTAGKSNGVVNAAQQSGGDIGTQINNAITALGGCGAIYIPSGSYTLSTTVGVASCIEIYGDGIGKTILNAPSLTTGNHMFSSTNKTDWTIRDMTLIGPSPSGATDVRGISAIGCTRCKATRLRVTNLTDGIDMLGSSPTSSDNIISENYILSMSNQGSAVLGDRNKIINNTVDTVGTTNQHHGIYLQAGTGNEVIGNQVQNVAGFCVHNFTIATSGIITASRIMGNYCNNAGTSGSGTRGCFAFAEQTPATGSRSGIIENNTCENTAGSSQFYISASDSVELIGNTARNYQGECITIQGSTGPFTATRVDASHNICFSGTVSGAAAIHVLPNSGVVQNVLVTDNIVDTAFGIGIWVQACSDCIISRNRIKDYNSQGSASNSGILLDASTVRNVVTLNQVSTVNVTGTPFAITTQNSTVTDNVIASNSILNNSQTIADNGLRNAIYGNKTQSNALMEITGIGLVSPTTTINLLTSNTSPTISTHFNTSGDQIVSNGTGTITITVGTGTATSTGALALPTATTGWNCWLTNQSRADLIQQTGSGTASATFTNFGTTFVATNWTNSDILRGGCTAY